MRFTQNADYGEWSGSDPVMKHGAPMRNLAVVAIVTRLLAIAPIVGAIHAIRYADTPIQAGE